MSELSGEMPAQRAADFKVRVGRLAGRQFGRLTRAQLLAVGIPNSTITRWASDGYLYAEVPTVYAVGHPGRSEEADLFTAVLYAGPGAALRGLSAAVWRGLVKWRTPPGIEISTPRSRLSLAANHKSNRLGKSILVHGRRDLPRVEYHGIPTVPIPQIVLGLAATGDLELVRIVLSQMDFMRILNTRALERVCGRGTLGSATLHDALGRPQPLFARARSPFEIRLVQVCELMGIPLPEINVRIAGITVDGLWRREMVVVECDGERNHATWRQKQRDTRNDMVLRGLGYLVIRYTSEKLDSPQEVRSDLMGQLEERRDRAVLSLAG